MGVEWFIKRLRLLDHPTPHPPSAKRGNTEAGLDAASALLKKRNTRFPHRIISKPRWIFRPS